MDSSVSQRDTDQLQSKDMREGRRAFEEERKQFQMVMKAGFACAYAVSLRRLIETTRLTGNWASSI